MRCSARRPAQAADALAVDVINASEPTLCAEKDNVYLKLQSGEARRFTVEAVHPAYVGTIVVDRWAPDFTNCDMSNDPSFKFEKRRLTIYETEEWQLVGLTFPSFWRPNQVPVRVGNRVETGFHLLQLWTRYQERAEEVLVLYPADGYWRARPLPPQNLRWSAYGSSFLIGPVETAGPAVRRHQGRGVRSGDADASRSNFVRGGSATLAARQARPGAHRARRELGAPIAARAAVRGAALDVRDAKAIPTWRRSAGARKDSQALDAGAGDGLQARQRGRAVGRAASCRRATTPARPTWCSAISARRAAEHRPQLGESARERMKA